MVIFFLFRKKPFSLWLTWDMLLEMKMKNVCVCFGRLYFRLISVGFQKPPPQNLENRGELKQTNGYRQETPRAWSNRKKLNKERKQTCWQRKLSRAWRISEKEWTNDHKVHSNVFDYHYCCSICRWLNSVILLMIWLLWWNISRGRVVWLDDDAGMMVVGQGM